MIEKTIDLLGLKASDRVTGFKGTISSVCFDLYGCVQVALTPPAGADGKLGDGHWFDVGRLEVGDKRAMPVPRFAERAAEPTAYDRGPAEKPTSGRRG